jgi:hypothetical protein
MRSERDDPGQTRPEAAALVDLLLGEMIMTEFLAAAEALRKRLVAIRDAVDVEINAVDFLVAGATGLDSSHLVALARQYRNAVAATPTARILH